VARDFTGVSDIGESKFWGYIPESANGDSVVGEDDPDKRSAQAGRAVFGLLTQKDEKQHPKCKASLRLTENFFNSRLRIKSPASLPACAAVPPQATTNAL
jgi:hypothetical protein